jgi:hypothetical protein
MKPSPRVVIFSCRIFLLMNWKNSYSLSHNTFHYPLPIFVYSDAYLVSCYLLITAGWFCRFYDYVLYYDVPTCDVIIILVNTHHSMERRRCEVNSCSARLVIKFSDVSGTRKFITVFTSSRYKALF